MAFQSMWVPGYVAVAEHQGGAAQEGPLRNYDGGPLGNIPQHNFQDVVGFRQGFGVHFRGKANQQVWFHFAIPTPVISDGDRVSIVRAFFLWSTRGGSQLLSFHVRDGARARLLAVDGINLAGTFDGSSGQPGGDPKLVDGANSFTFPQPQPVFYGIGVSALIGFDQNSDDSDVFFASAGADFTTVLAT
jgi:hypothetical protein